MGKTKTKVMDSPEENAQEKKPVRKLGRQDDLVERLKAELAGIGTTSSDELVKDASSDTTTTPVVNPSVNEESQDTKGKSKDSSPSVQNDKQDKPKKPQVEGKSKPRSKKYKEASKDLDKTQNYALAEAIELVKKGSYSKFTGTLEAHINTVNSNIRGLVSLPFVSGKKLTILAFGKEANESGADIIGTEEVIENINKGKLGFDLVITSPEWMPKLAKVARILGPRGLMPNPKNGTITDDLKKAVAGFQGGKTEYKTEPKGFVIHLSMGKLDQPIEELSANIKTLIQTLGKTRVKKVTLSPTIGPGVKLDLSSL